MELFAPDKYADTDPKYRKCSDDVRCSILTFLNEAYCIQQSAVNHVEQSGGVEVNSKNFRVRVGQTSLLAKRLDLDHKNFRNRNSVMNRSYVSTLGCVSVIFRFPKFSRAWLVSFSYRMAIRSGV